MGGFLHTRLGKIKLSINLSNIKDWRHGYFKAEVTFEIDHHGYNEKGVFTVAREHDDTGKKTDILLIGLVHLTVPPSGVSQLIPTFLIHLDSDLLTVWNGTFIGGPIKLNFNGKLDFENKNIRLDLSSHGRAHGLELDWYESSADHIRCKALYTSGGVVDTVLSFHVQRKAKNPIFGMSISRGNTDLLTFEAVSELEPELVHYDLTYASELFGNGKMKLDLKTEKALPDKNNWNVLREKTIELQLLPDNNTRLLMRTTAEYIGHVRLRLTTAITYNDAPLFDHELVFDKLMGNVADQAYKINVVSMAYPGCVLRNFMFSTCDVNGYLSFNFRNPSQFQLSIDTTFDGLLCTFNINTHKFPFGFELEIFDEARLFRYLLNPFIYDKYIPFWQKLKVTQKFGIDTTRYADAHGGLEFYFNADDIKEYNISGIANIDLKYGLEGKAKLQTFMKIPGGNKTHILKVDCKRVAATEDFDIKVSLSKESRYRPHHYELDMYGNLDLTNFGFNFYRDKSKKFELAIKGEEIKSYLAYFQYEITYQFPESGFKGDKIRISIGLSRLPNLRIALQYIPAYYPQTRIVLNFQQEKAKYTAIKEIFDAYKLSVIYQDPSLNMYNPLKLMKAEFKGSTEMASNNPFAIKLKFLVKFNDLIKFEFNNNDSPFRVEMYDPYLLPEIYVLAGLPRKETFKILGLKESDPKGNVLKTDGSADIYIFYDDSNTYELWQAKNKLLMIWYDDGSAEANVFVFPGDQSLNAKVRWQLDESKHEFKVNISGLETHNIKLYTDGVNTYKLEANGDNIWLGKYNITTEVSIMVGLSQLKGRWSGKSNIENAPWTSSVHTQVDFDFPYRVDCRNVCYHNPPPELGYKPPPCRPCAPPPPPMPPGYGEPVALSLMPAEPRNWFLNVSKKASGMKFGFIFNNGRISLH